MEMPNEVASEEPKGSSDSPEPVTPGPQLLFRAPVAGLLSYSAGRSARDAQRIRQRAGSLAALAANEAPYGPFPNVLSTLQLNAAIVNRYPESGFGTLRERLAEHLSLPVTRIAVAAGGTSVIHHVSLALLEPDDEVIQCTPSFHLYALDARKLGARTVSVSVTHDGRYDLEAMRRKIGARTRLIYVCNPNNPTGGIVRRDELLRFVTSVPGHVAILIDEAYFEYVDAPEYPNTVRDTAFHLPNLVTLRTFSKAYGLAGLRVAYAAGEPRIIAALRKLQNNYEVTSLSQVAAIASLENEEELERRRALNRAGRATLLAGLQSLGYSPLPSHGNFVCVRVGAAREVAAALELRGVLVRPLDAMGDPTSIRITVGTESEISQALEAIAAVTTNARRP
jgi:histidinol-phosphate aminotransferase